MSNMTKHGLVIDLLQAAQTMADMDAFPTGQSIMKDAAEEIERLRDELVTAHTSRLFIAGFSQGWDAAVESGLVMEDASDAG